MCRGNKKHHPDKRKKRQKGKGKDTQNKHNRKKKIRHKRGITTKGALVAGGLLRLHAPVLPFVVSQPSRPVDRMMDAASGE